MQRSAAYSRTVANPNRHAFSNAYGYPYGNTHGHSHSHAYAYSCNNAHGDCYSYPYADSYSLSLADSYSYPNADSHGHPLADSHSYPYADRRGSRRLAHIHDYPVVRKPTGHAARRGCRVDHQALAHRRESWRNSCPATLGRRRNQQRR